MPTIRINKKGYMITPIIFIVLFILGILYSFYVSGIDAEVASGIKTSATIEKGITDLYKEQMKQLTFGKISAHVCSNSDCYNNSDLSTKNAIKTCITGSLKDKYGNDTDWNVEIDEQSGIYFLKFNASSFNATNINMVSDRFYVKERLDTSFFKLCGE